MDASSNELEAFFLGFFLPKSSFLNLATSGAKITFGLMADGSFVLSIVDLYLLSNWDRRIACFSIFSCEAVGHGQNPLQATLTRVSCIQLA